MKDAASSPAVSPGGKKLVQARLPFKVVTPASPASPVSRKRKLSESTESANKITKPSKETEVVAKEDDVVSRKRKLSENTESAKPTNENEVVAEEEDLVVISDDDSETPPHNNPYFKIAEKALIKKLQKKSPRKRKSKTNNDKNKKKGDRNGHVAEKSQDDVRVVDDEIEGISEVPNGEIDDTEMTEMPVEVVLTETELGSSSEKLESKTKTDDVKNDNVEKDKSSETAKPDDILTPVTPVPNAPITKPIDSEQIGAENKIPIETFLNSPTPDVDVEHVEIPWISDNEDSMKTEDAINVEKIEIQKSPDSDVSNPKNINNRDTKINPSNSKEGESVTDVQVSNNVTPKRRSIRNKKSPEKSYETSSQITKSDSSAEVTTPKQKTKRSLASANSPTSPANTSLTPKQLQRKLESAKKKEDKEKERLDREKKRLQEKEERNRLKLEKEEQRKKEREEREEQKRKEREEKEEQKKKEKEEKDKQRELEKKEKEEKEEQRKKEKEVREEERKKKLEAIEEEKRQKELEKQEQELKKKKAAAAFVSFFVPKQKSEQTESTQSKNSMLSSFTVKSDMRLAPMIRNGIDSEQKNSLDGHLKSQRGSKDDLYLQSLRDNVTKPRRSQKTWPLDDKEDDCMIVESEDELPPVAMTDDEVMMSTSTVRERLRPKLLCFHENRRPPYWGTWRKKSSTVTPRRPFGTDTKHLDYDVDSDSEWEEEGEGESIAGSVAGSVEDPEDEYEVDNDFFVPHGYLSDEEGTMDGDDVLSLSPETQKAKLRHLEEEFESEMKKPTEKLKPRLYGMLWENSEGGKPENCIDALWKYFGKMAMIMDDPTALLQPSPEIEENEKKKSKKKKATEEANSPKSTDKRKKTKPVKKDVADVKKTTEPLKNQPGINTFLMKIKT